jgi:hypothetical protein
MDPNSIYKFGSLQDPRGESIFLHPNVWARERTSGPERLAIAPAAQHINILRTLLDLIPEPFHVLYVLAISRGGGEPGRYQSSTPKTKADVDMFLSTFVEFLELDARHRLWIKSVSTNDLLVYEQHNLIYVYGELGRMPVGLEAFGLKETDSIHIPVPHTHKYNERFDFDQEKVLDYWEWQQSPIQDSDL